MADQLASGLIAMLQPPHPITSLQGDIIGRSAGIVRRIVRRSSRRARRFRERQESERREFVMALITLLGVQARPDRVVWMRERSSHWFRDIVLATFGDQEWLENFRMRRATFDHIVATLTIHIGRADTNMRRSIRVAVTLWMLATGAGFRSVGHLFCIAKCTCCVIFHDTCAAIVHVLLRQYIKMLNAARLMEITEGFATRFGFPNCAGVIDRTHIPIVAPQRHHTDYHNRKGYHSIVAQVMCDHQYQVMNIAVGWPGRVHDARVLANSSIFAKAEVGVLLPERPLQLGNTMVPLVILGDPTYPLRPWLMKAFSDTGRLTRDQTNYNYRLSRARMTIENTFGRCKARWRIILKRMDIRTEDVTTVTLVCFTLNNICEVHMEAFNEDWADVGDEGANQEPHNVAHDMEGDGNGGDIRDVFMSYFSS